MCINAESKSERKKNQQKTKKNWRKRDRCELVICVQHDASCIHMRNERDGDDDCLEKRLIKIALQRD